MQPLYGFGGENSNPNLPRNTNNDKGNKQKDAKNIPGGQQQNLNRLAVGGTKVRGGQSDLDPPVRIPIIELKNDDKGFMQIINNDGSRRTSTDVDTNVSWQEGCFARNSDHWGTPSLVRELDANGKDAASESNHHTWGDKDPTFKNTTSLTPLSGFTAINGYLATSWNASVVRVKENPAYHKHSRDTADLPPHYIEFTASKGKRVKKKKGLKTASRKRSIGDVDGDGDENDDDDEDDDDSDYGDGDDDEAEEQDACDVADDSDEETCLYRVAIFIRSFSVFHLEGLVNSFSSKNNFKSKVLR